MNLIIIIPHYNDNLHLVQLLVALRENVDLPILVIDDGSDKEPLIDKPIHFLRNKCNRGKGYTLRKAFIYASELGYTHAITMDADLQHSPRDIGSFANVNSSIDLVLGYRSFKHPMPAIRIISNYITTKIIQISSGNDKLLDTQCGYRRYNLKKVLSNNYIETGFQFESEVLIKMASLPTTCIENVKIATVYSNENSSISNVKDTMKFIGLIFRSLFWKTA
tara:strand:+ start:250 stop:912 length:663 start_codon:yes stop_codon:yes gene_type:complete